MTSAEWNAVLARLRQRGSQWGTQRIRQALAAFGHPERRLRVVHIAGTNGKGSTARMLRQILTTAGYRTGSFTSPAVLSPTETITIDGKPISEEALLSIGEDLLPLLGTDVGGLTEFEWLTVVALTWFSREHVDIAVVECGMGGAGDATNVFSSPLACVFTPIALDHTAILGDTVEEIARQKSGILRPACDAVCAPATSPEALGVLMEEAAMQGATLHVGSSAIATVREDGNALHFSRGNAQYVLHTVNRIQVDNAVTVLDVVDVLRGKGWYIEEDAVREGLAATRFPCRQELFEGRPPVLLDAAHNPHGIAALADTIARKFPKKPILLLGMLRDKDVAASVRLLEAVCSEAICCTPKSERALDAAELAPLFSQLPTTVRATPESALPVALKKAEESGKALVIGGSFYVAAPLRPLLLKP